MPFGALVGNVVWRCWERGVNRPAEDLAFEFESEPMWGACCCYGSVMILSMVCVILSQVAVLNAMLVTCHPLAEAQLIKLLLVLAAFMVGLLRICVPVSEMRRHRHAVVAAWLTFWVADVATLIVLWWIPSVSSREVLISCMFADVGGAAAAAAAATAARIARPGDTEPQVPTAAVAVNALASTGGRTEDHAIDDGWAETQVCVFD